MYVLSARKEESCLCRDSFGYVGTCDGQVPVGLDVEIGKGYGERSAIFKST